MTPTRSLTYVLMVAVGPGLPNLGEAHETRAHWKYPPACCKGNVEAGDCERIPGAGVTKGRNDFSIHLRPRDHHLATREHLFFVPYGSELPSGDSDFHLCLHPTEDHLNCFFAPPDGV